MRTRLPWLLLLGLLPATAMCADDDEVTSGWVAPDVVLVASRAWPSQVAGRVRIVVTTHGFEHVSTRVVAQWLDLSDAAPAPWAITATRVLVEPGLLALDAPRLSNHGDAVRVELEGVHTYQPELDVACTFDLLADGEVRTVRACGD